MHVPPLVIALGGIAAVTVFYLATSKGLRPAGHAMGDAIPALPGGDAAYRQAQALYARGQWNEALGALRQNYDATTANAMWHRLLNERR